MIAVLRRVVEVTLIIVTLSLLIALAAVVLYAVAARTAGSSPIWYDEVASVMLAWLTFLGAPLATLKSAHLNFETLLMSRKLASRKIMYVTGELIYYAVFVLIAWAGWTILEIFGDETLTSLRFIPLAAVQSVVPVSAALMILTRLLLAPASWQRMLEARDAESEEIAAEIARAREELAKTGPAGSRHD